MLARDKDIASNAELSVMTLREQFLTDAEAWAWLSTIQVALRSTAVANGILSDEKLELCLERSPRGHPHDAALSLRSLRLLLTSSLIGNVTNM